MLLLCSAFDQYYGRMLLITSSLVAAILRPS